MAFNDITIHRNFFAGAHPQLIALLYLFQRNIFFVPIFVDTSRKFGRKIQQRADCFAGTVTRPQFQYLPEQYQRHNDRIRFKINSYMSVGIAHGRG